MCFLQYVRRWWNRRYALLNSDLGLRAEPPLALHAVSREPTVQDG